LEQVNVQMMLSSENGQRLMMIDILNKKQSPHEGGLYRDIIC